jgi:CheY-like chemotaxis protein
MVKVSANSLLHVINDILDFSKIEAGKLDMESIPFALRGSIEPMLKMLALKAREKGLAMNCAIADDVPDGLAGDATRVRQVLINLINNAVKFTARGEVNLRIALDSASETSACLHFVVEDTGIGIPADKQAHIFEAFAQADGSTTRRFGGTGLGLTICRQLVEMMGGRIWVTSVPDHGSAFHFTASFVVAAPSVTTPPVEHPQKPPERHRPLHILLAEDNAVNQMLASRLLQKRGHTVVMSGNGREALERFAEERFDLVLMDIQMPEVDGRTHPDHRDDGAFAQGR